MTIASALISAGVAVHGQKKDREAQSDLETAQRGERAERKRQLDLRAARERRNTIREARIARANIVSAGAQSGAAAGSSSIAGGTSSVSSQLGANLSFLDAIQTSESNIGIFQEAGLGAQRTKQKAGARTRLVTTIFSNSERFT